MSKEPVQWHTIKSVKTRENVNNDGDKKRKISKAKRQELLQQTKTTST